MPMFKRGTPRFESFPPEIRNMIYKELLSAESCKELRLRQFVPHWDPQHQYVYNFHTAILRANRLIGQEAKYVLYGSNVLVFIDTEICDRRCLMLSGMPQNVAFNHIPKGTPLPPYLVRINHEVEYSEHERVWMIVAAADLHLICEKIHDGYGWHGCLLRASLSLVALPQLGCPYESLLNMIWLPLIALREYRCSEIDGLGSSSFEILDKTGLFEQTNEVSDWEEKSEQESKTDSDRDNDTEEGKSDGNGSNDDEIDEDDIENIGSASTDSDEVDNGDDDGDEYGKARDGSDEVTSNDHCSTEPGGKTFRGVASDSSHAGDASAAIVVKDNIVARGCFDGEPYHKVPSDDESKGDSDGIVDEGEIEEH